MKIPNYLPKYSVDSIKRTVCLTFQAIFFPMYSTINRDILGFITRVCLRNKNKKKSFPRKSTTYYLG